MAIISQQIVEDSPQSNNRRRVQYAFTDHLGVVYTYGEIIVSDTFDADVDILSRVVGVEKDLADKEIYDAVSGVYIGISPEKVPEHQSQAVYDRRVLGRMMLVEDAHAFYAAYPMFQAVELRGGANTNQRATYLGIPSATYALIANRFNNVSGISWFLSDEKNTIWDALPVEID